MPVELDKRMHTARLSHLAQFGSSFSPITNQIEHTKKKIKTSFFFFLIKIFFYLNRHIHFIEISSTHGHTSAKIFLFFQVPMKITQEEFIFTLLKCLLINIFLFDS